MFQMNILESRLKAVEVMELVILFILDKVQGYRILDTRIVVVLFVLFVYKSHACFYA